RPAARRGRQDHLGPLCWPDQPGPCLLGDVAPRCHRARVGPWPGRQRPRRSRRGRADRRADLAAWQAAADHRLLRRRRHLCGGAGDMCAVAKLPRAATGDTLSDRERPLLMESGAMAEPLLPIAITAKSKADEDKLSQALSRLVAEDSTLRLENNAETHQLVLW